MTDSSLIDRGFRKFAISLVFLFVVPYIIYYFLLPDITQFGLPDYGGWIVKWGLVASAMSFAKWASREDSWRYAFWDLLSSIVNLIFLFKVLSLEISIPIEAVSIVISIEGFFYISMIATFVSIVGKFVRLLEG
ncbi:MAG: hypothetical protein ACTSVF_00125 [Candidatus Asgardarchaeia archaeon]